MLVALHLSSVIEVIDAKHSYAGLPLCRHYLVIPKEHIPTVRNLQRRAEDYSLGIVIIISCNSFMVFLLK